MASSTPLLILKLPEIFLSFSFSLFCCGLAILLLYCVFRQILCYLNPLRKLPLPPGPPPKDILSGNAGELLSSQLWFTLTDWAEQYGNMVHFRLFNTHMIALNSLDHATELLEKRSNIYSDRPYIPMINLIGWMFATGFKTYGPDWHAHRRLMQQMFKPASSLKYRPTQTEKVDDFLSRLLNDPNNFSRHIKTLSVAIIMSTMYGYDSESSSEIREYEVLAEKAVDVMSQSSYPGAALVNILPCLRFVPSWFPGAQFQHFAQESKALVNRMQDVPYKYVQKSMAEGTASPSIVAILLETCKSKEDHVVLKEFAATGYSAGADTTIAALETFFYAMSLYPDVQKKAQEDLDRVVGNDRLPNFSDEPRLPYIQALLREILRWRPILPLSIFHASTSDDVYNGYYIPKGSTIVPNVWAMTRNPEKYQDPETFNPDRFFDSNKKLNNDTLTYVFGFGRRICPGRHMASATIWLVIATVLSTFDIKPPKDTLESEVPLKDIEYTGGLISHINPFKCVITPRSGKAKQLIVDINNSKLQQHDSQL